MGFDWNFGRIDAGFLRRRPLFGDLPPLVVEILRQGQWELIEDSVWNDDVTPLQSSEVPHAYDEDPLLDGPPSDVTETREAWLRAAVEQTANDLRLMLHEAKHRLEGSPAGGPDHEDAKLTPLRAQATVKTLNALRGELFRLDAYRSMGSGLE